MHTVEYLGCTITQLREHLEAKFQEGMTWENYGQWHVDHIIPLRYREGKDEPSLDEIIQRLHWTNCQPLWAKDNIAKGNRWVGGPVNPKVKPEIMPALTLEDNDVDVLCAAFNIV
jgi:5-methylcytosine-specific restriction endonuclease McrA